MKSHIENAVEEGWGIDAQGGEGSRSQIENAGQEWKGKEGRSWRVDLDIRFKTQGRMRWGERGGGRKGGLKSQMERAEGEGISRGGGGGRMYSNRRFKTHGKGGL